MKRKNVLWGIGFILVAILLILHTFGVDFGLPINLPLWKIILSVVLIIFIIEQAIKLRFVNVFFPLIFIVMIFESEIALSLGIENGDLAPTWTFLLIALLLSIGFALLNKKTFTFTYNKDNEKHVYTGEEAKEKFKEVLNNSSVYYIDCSEKFYKEIDTDLCKTEVFFTNAELYNGDGVIKVDNNLGKIIFHVPSNWIVDCSIDNSLGSVQSFKQNDTGEPVKKLKVTGSNNLGKIEFVIAE